MCNSDYDFERGLKIEAFDGSHSSLPLLMLVKEIHLFLISLYHYSSPKKIFLSNEFSTWQADEYQLVLAPSIFHPPSVLA
jgi:hypothetical protein